jgi:hypothetical protein
VIANAIAVLRAVGCYGIFNQQPPQTPFQALGIFANRVLIKPGFSLMVAPPAQKACHIGQCGAENRLYLKAFHLLVQPGSMAVNR